jgi:hypothetical protein
MRAPATHHHRAKRVVACFCDSGGVSNREIARQVSGELPMKFPSPVRRAGFILLAMIMFLVGIWCSVAIWYQCGAGEPVRGLMVTAAAFLTLMTVTCLAMPKRWLILGIYLISIAAFLEWWASISPTNDRKWAPDVERLPQPLMETR